MKKIAVYIYFLIMAVRALTQDIYIGTTLGFTDYLENKCGIVFKENGIPADPFKSTANHGATIVRIHVGHPPYSSSYSEGLQVDHHSVENAKISLARVKEAGLKSLLTFTYQSFALEDEDNLNIYVAPLAWQPIALDLEKIADSVYAYTYAVLDEYCGEDLIPEIVSIGAESTWHRLMPNVPEEELPAYDPARSVALHNAGSQAVRDLALKYDTVIKVCFHMRGPSTTKWWLETHWPYGLDLDMIGISLYYGWNFDDYAGYNSLGEYVAAITDTYGIEFIVMETAQLFTEGGNDSHVDILGLDLIPPGYPNPPTTETQKKYLADITKEVLDNGGSGVIVWGGDWVGSDCYIYADQWGKGSSWENKAFWDFDYNLHDGVNWMMAFSGKVAVTFKIDMTGVDTSNGVYVTGDFENFEGESWAFNRMKLEDNNIYFHTAYIIPGSSGEYYFLNDTLLTARETIPDECAYDTSLNRQYTIPLNSSGETFANVWSSCDTIPHYELDINVNGNGFTSHITGMYSTGMIINLLATPELGWEFINWTGDTISAENPLMVIMNSNKHFIANFNLIPKAPVTFKVDMTGVDVSNGVYVTGDFPNQEGKTWQLNQMYHQGGIIYHYSTLIPVGSKGAYYFLNDDKWGVRETVPAECAEYWDSDRGYDIPLNSTGETFGFKWSSCEAIPPASVNGPVHSGYESLVEIYPNPVPDEQITLAFNTEDVVNIRIMDILGRIAYERDVQSLPNGKHSIGLQSFPKGIYLMRIFFRNHNTLHSEVFIISK